MLSETNQQRRLRALANAFFSSRTAWRCKVQSRSRALRFWCSLSQPSASAEVRLHRRPPLCRASLLFRHRGFLPARESKCSEQRVDR